MGNPFYQHAVKPLVVATAASFCAASAVSAQNYAGKKITAIQIEYAGVKTVDEARIRNFMSVKPGQKYNADKLDNDIRSLYESGLVDNVSFTARPAGGGVKLTAKVATRPVLNSIGFRGNRKFSDKALAGKTDLNAGGILGEREIIKAIQNMQEKYENAGFPDVSITHQLQKTGRAGVANAIFFIDEGQRNIVHKVRFEGNTVFGQNDLKKEMKTRKKGIFSFFTRSGKIDRAVLDEDVERVLDFYQNAGYLKASSTGARIVPVKGDKVEIVIPVNEGVKYTVNKVSFGKMTVFTAEELAPSLILRGGDAYSGKRMREDITTIKAYYGSRGYADVSVVPEITNAAGNSVNIVYRVTEGKPYRVGRVNIEGNNITQDRVIRREVPLKPGDNFNSVELRTIRNRLKNMGYFSQVSADAGPSTQPGYRDVNILVQEQKTGNVGFGVGFSSIDNVVGYINLQQSNFDLFNWRNFRGGGQRFAMNLRAGSESKDFSISLTEPWMFGRRLEFGTQLYYKNLLYVSDEYDLTKIGGAMHFRKAMGKKSYVRAEYRLEDIEVDIEDDVPLASDFNAEAGDYLRSAVTLNYVYDGRDANIDPRKGHKVDVGVTFTGGPLGGDVDTYTVYAKASKHWNMKWDTILTLKGELSVVDNHGDSDVVPIFERQFLGGARSLRGFEFNDVGPRDAATEEVLGGKSAGFLTAEFTMPLVDNIRGAAFVDAGFVSEKAWDIGSEIYADAGLGLRLKLPFGPIALDYAIPVKSPDELADKGGQFNFYMNYAF